MRRWNVLLLMLSITCGPPALAEKEEETSIRRQRPVTFSAAFLGKTPIFGFNVDANPHPHAAIGTGYGIFSTDGASGSFIPVYLQAYALDSLFSPFAVVGVDFVTVKLQSRNALLNSTFTGTQLVIGGGFEYRFAFGLNARVEAVRFVHAKVWSPGLAIGYSMLFL